MLLGTVERVDTTDVLSDGFSTSIIVKVDSLVSGRFLGSRVHIRWPEGKDVNGNWQSTVDSIVGPFTTSPLRVADRILVLTSRTKYEEQVQVKAGNPVMGVTGGFYGIFRVSPEGKIKPSGDLVPPDTLRDLRSKGIRRPLTGP